MLVVHRKFTIAAALAAKQLALARAKFLKPLNVLIVDVGRTRTSVFRAKPAPILSTAPEFLPNHKSVSPNV